MPGATGNGRHSRRTVELVDVCPTLLDVCGIGASGSPKPDGTSMRPLLDDPDAKWDEPAYTQVTRGNRNPRATPQQGQAQAQARNPPFMGRSVRTETLRYTEWGDGGALGRELYDYDTDPDERKNLAEEPAQAGVVERMRRLLAAPSGGASEGGRAK